MKCHEIEGISCEIIASFKIFAFVKKLIKKQGRPIMAWSRGLNLPTPQESHHTLKSFMLARKTCQQSGSPDRYLVLLWLKDVASNVTCGVTGSFPSFYEH